MAKQRNSLGMIVLDATYDAFGTEDPISFDEYKERTGVDLNDLVSGGSPTNIAPCSKLVLGLFESNGGGKVLTHIRLNVSASGTLQIDSGYDEGSGDVISSRLFISGADKTVTYGEV